MRFSARQTIRLTVELVHLENEDLKDAELRKLRADAERAELEAANLRRIQRQREERRRERERNKPTPMDIFIGLLAYALLCGIVYTIARLCFR